jgi:transposase
MPSRGGPVHVVTTTRTYNDTVYKTHLLRRSYREDGKVKNETVGNISHLPDSLVDLVRRSLQGESFAAITNQFEITRSVAQGHIHVVRLAMQRLGFDSLLSSRPCRERDLVAAMVVARIVAPHTKLATTRWWHTTTLAEDLGVADADEEQLYEAMDWLLLRQSLIEKKLVARHIDEHSLVLYDLSSSYFEGVCCPLAQRGHNRDGKKGKLQVNYGIATDRRGCPVALSVFEGSTSDSKTLMPQVEQIRSSFGIKKFVIVGDRGMISQKTIDTIKSTESLKGLDWISALKAAQISTLAKAGVLQLGLFDERNLFELTHPDFPGERLVACRNVELGKLRDHKRQSLLQATSKELEKVQRMVQRGKLKSKDQIGVRVGKIINKYKVAKHFSLDIQDGRFEFCILQEKVAAEAALDGIYVIRTGLPKDEMHADEAVRSYKMLSNVERAFRTIKTIDLKVRPIHHRLADRVRSHILLCMLAYYVEWHMREAWRPVLFSDEDQDAKRTRDPVAPAKRSDAALEKVHTHTLDDGTPAHSFQTLMQLLSTIVRNTCRALGSDDVSATFQVVTTPSAEQRRAFDLIKAITM